MNYNFLKNRYDIDGDSISISKDILKKIMFLIRNNSSLGHVYSFYNKLNDLLKEDKDSYEVSIDDFFKIEKEINSCLRKPFILGIENEKLRIFSRDEDFNKLSSPLLEDLSIWFDKLKSILNVDFYEDRLYGVGIKDNDENKIEAIFNAINVLYEYMIREVNYHRFRDLLRERNNIFNSLNSFCDELVVNKFASEYNSALNERPMDINKIQSILERAQKKILDHWNTYVSDVDSFESGKPFKFICHSMKGIRKFSGPFDTRYISTSLLSEDAMDVYNRGFGLIFGPKNIVGADSEDMYANNSNEFDDARVQGSVLPTIKSPELIIKECKERKKIRPNHSAYNEVIIDGFEPIGIFCLTDGSKKINSNYVKAHELKELFPDLKVIEIDQTLYKTGPELFEVKRVLLERLESVAGGTLKIDDDYVKSLGLFWDKYIELKKNKDYNEDQIIELYERNKSLLFFVNYDKLFDNYSLEEIEVIIKYNYSLGLRYVINGEYKFFCLENIYERLKKYSYDMRLNKYVDGLNEFLQLFPMYFKSLTEEEKNQICEFNNFRDINSFLRNRNNKFKEVKKEESIRVVEDIIYIDDSLSNDKGEMAL